MLPNSTYCGRIRLQRDQSIDLMDVVLHEPGAVFDDKYTLEVSGVLGCNETWIVHGTRDELLARARGPEWEMVLKLAIPVIDAKLAQSVY